MSYSTRLSKEKVDAVPPQAIQSYLQERGWTQDDRILVDDVLVFRSPGGREAEVWLPQTRDFADYAIRVGEVLDTVAVVEDRALWEVFDDVISHTTGVIVTSRTWSPQSDYPWSPQQTPLPQLLSQFSENVNSFEKISREEVLDRAKWSELTLSSTRIDHIARLIDWSFSSRSRETDASFAKEIRRYVDCLESLREVAPPKEVTWLAVKQQKFFLRLEYYTKKRAA